MTTNTTTAMPPIPIGSPYFVDWNYDGLHQGWFFEIHADNRTRRVLLEYRHGLGNMDLKDIEQFRPIIAAVAAAHWRKEARRYEALQEIDDWFDEYDDTSMTVREVLGNMTDFLFEYPDVCRFNAGSWEHWGGWR